MISSALIGLPLVLVFFWLMHSQEVRNDRRLQRQEPPTSFGDPGYD